MEEKKKKIEMKAKQKKKKIVNSEFWVNRYVFPIQGAWTNMSVCVYQLRGMKQ